jgi:hypothetical protein
MEVITVRIDRDGVEVGKMLIAETGERDGAAFADEYSAVITAIEGLNLWARDTKIYAQHDARVW